MANVYGKGLTGLLKRGWNEIPGVMAGLVMASIGIGCGTYSVVTRYKNGPRDPFHTQDYIVVRPDDPKPRTTTEDYDNY